jgi:hypothetical protein
MILEAPFVFGVLNYLKDYATHAVKASEARTLATLLILKEWDSRTGISRLWLSRKNPNWMIPGRALEPMVLDFKNPTADDAESVFHANMILNFVEDVALAKDNSLISPDTIEEDLIPTFKLWWARTKPLRDIVEADKRAPGWHRAASLLGISTDQSDDPTEST